jgi:lipoprotein signal peptidase
VASGAGNRTEAPPKGRLLRIGIAVAALVAIDQLTKTWAVKALADAPLHVIGDRIGFDLSRNPGSAFGRFQGLTTLLAIGAIVVSLLIVREARHAPDRMRLVGYTLVLGGALGNLSDRVFRTPGFLKDTSSTSSPSAASRCSTSPIRASRSGPSSSSSGPCAHRRRPTRRERHRPDRGTARARRGAGRSCGRAAHGLESR